MKYSKTRSYFLLLFQAAGRRKQQPGNETASLADFFRNTGPPEPPSHSVKQQGAGKSYLPKKEKVKICLMSPQPSSL